MNKNHLTISDEVLNGKQQQKNSQRAYSTNNLIQQIKTPTADIGRCAINLIRPSSQSTRSKGMNKISIAATLKQDEDFAQPQLQPPLSFAASKPKSNSYASQSHLHIKTERNNTLGNDNYCSYKNKYSLENSQVMANYNALKTSRQLTLYDDIRFSLSNQS